MKITKKQFSLTWVFESFDERIGFSSKRMFGGLVAYLFGKMVMVLVEDDGAKSWRGKNYNFDIWNGILLPTEKEYHQSLIKDFPNLIFHPVLGKWLYLPIKSDNFEEEALKISNFIANDDQRFGILPKIKTTSKKKFSKSK